MSSRDPVVSGPVDEPGASGLPIRLAARVLVLDPDDRALLFRYDDDPPNGRHWDEIAARDVTMESRSLPAEPERRPTMSRFSNPVRYQHGRDLPPTGTALRPVWLSSQGNLWSEMCAIATIPLHSLGVAGSHGLELGPAVTRREPGAPAAR